MRCCFETWATTHSGLSLNRMPAHHVTHAGVYCSVFIQFAWEAWQEATRQANEGGADDRLSRGRG